MKKHNNEKLNCHSSTSYKEIDDFLQANKGNTIIFHYEEAGHISWGNDYIEKIKLDKEGLKQVYKHLGSKEKHGKDYSTYVHNIEVIKN